MLLPGCRQWDGLPLTPKEVQTRPHNRLWCWHTEELKGRNRWSFTRVSRSDQCKFHQNLALKKTLTFKSISRNSGQNPWHYGVHSGGVWPTKKWRIPISLLLGTKLLKKKTLRKMWFSSIASELIYSWYKTKLRNDMFMHYSRWQCKSTETAVSKVVIAISKNPTL